MKQMKYGKPEFAVTLLKKVYEDCKNEPEPAYNVEMALVEILIYQVHNLHMNEKLCFIYSLSDNHHSTRFCLIRANIEKPWNATASRMNNVSRPTVDSLFTRFVILSYITLSITNKLKKINK